MTTTPVRMGDGTALPSQQRWAHRASVLAAVVTGLQVAVTTVDGATRPGYEPHHHLISHLSLGDRGWLGVVNLSVGAAIVAVLAVALSRALPPGRAAKWGSGLVGAAALGLLLAAIFPIDPGLGYPPGSEASHSATGSIHDFAGMLVFGGLTAAAAALGRAVGGRRSAAARWGCAMAFVVAASFVATSVLLGLEYSGAWPGAPSGLFERIAMYAGLGWITAVAFLARRPARAR